jgi:hypothetical protein
MRSDEGVSRRADTLIRVHGKKWTTLCCRYVSGRRRWSKLNEWLAATAMRDRRKSETA